MRSAAALVFALGASTPLAAAAHEPVFGLGPHTIYKGGVSVSASGGLAASGDGEVVSSSVGVTYGVTQDLSLAVGLPWMIVAPSLDAPGAIGDPVAQVKWRPLASFSKRNVDALSVIGAVKLPAGDEAVSLGNTGGVPGDSLTIRRWDQVADTELRRALSGGAPRGGCPHARPWQRRT